MKRIVLLLLASLPMLVQAQNVSWKFFDRYTKAEGFTSVQLERKMMRMMSRQAAEKGDEGLAGLLDGIQYIRIVAFIKESVPFFIVLIAELLMLTYGTKETVAVNIYGQFDLKQVARLSSIRPQR